MGTTSSNSTTMDRLRDVLNEYTGLEAKFVGMITYDDPRLMELPIIIPHGSPNESEKENLAEYIMAGGFIFGGLNTEALEKYGGLTQVKDFWSERLSDTHPVYGGWGWFKDNQGGDSTRQLQLAVNIIIYALTQGGSITQRLMPMVN